MAGRLLIVSGLPGVGKTAVARDLARDAGAVHLSIDAVEEAILACGLPSGWQVGVAAYEAVGAMATANLEIGTDVVVDAVNDSQPARDTWHRAAAHAHSRIAWIHLVCSDRAEHRARLAGRDRGFAHVDEPTWAQVVEREQSYEAWREPCTVLDTVGAPIQRVVQAAVRAWPEP